MDKLKSVRLEIKNDNIKKAVKLLEEVKVVCNSDFLSDSLLLIKVRLTRWNKRKYLGFDPPEAEYNEIVYNLIQFIQEVESFNKKDNDLTSSKIRGHLSESIKETIRVELMKEELLFIEFLEHFCQEETSSIFYFDIKKLQLNLRLQSNRNKLALIKKFKNEIISLEKLRKEILLKIMVENRFPAELKLMIEEIITKELSLFEIKIRSLRYESALNRLNENIQIQKKKLSFYKKCSKLGKIGSLIFITWEVSKRFNYERINSNYDEEYINESGFDLNQINAKGFFSNGVHISGFDHKGKKVQIGKFDLFILPPKVAYDVYNEQNKNIKNLGFGDFLLEDINIEIDFGDE